MTNGASEKRTGFQQFMYIVNSYWKPISTVAAVFGLFFVLSWPSIREKMNIASNARVDGVEMRLTAMEVRLITVEARASSNVINNALNTVLLAQLTGRISEGEATFRITQIANGKYDQDELLKLILNKPED